MICFIVSSRRSSFNPTEISLFINAAQRQNEIPHVWIQFVSMNLFVLHWHPEYLNFVGVE